MTLQDIKKELFSFNTDELFELQKDIQRLCTQKNNIENERRLLDFFVGQRILTKDNIQVKFQNRTGTIISINRKRIRVLLDESEFSPSTHIQCMPIHIQPFFNQIQNISPYIIPTEKSLDAETIATQTSPQRFRIGDQVQLKAECRGKFSNLPGTVLRFGTKNIIVQTQFGDVTVPPKLLQKISII